MAAKTGNLPKTIWGIAVIVVAILIFYLFRECNKPVPPEVVKVRVDTLWHDPVEIVITKEKPVPYKVIQRDTTTLHDTLIEVLPIDTALLFQEFYATKYYRDSFNVEHGKVTIEDTVTRNSISGRSVKTSFNIPIIKETITLKEPKKAIFYIGAEGLGNKQTLLYASGFSIGMKTKNDMYYGLKGLVITNSNPIYGIEFKIPLKLKK